VRQLQEKLFWTQMTRDEHEEGNVQMMALFSMSQCLRGSLPIHAKTNLYKLLHETLKKLLIHPEWLVD
jgi:hypothetical protein